MSEPNETERRYAKHARTCHPDTRGTAELLANYREELLVEFERLVESEAETATNSAAASDTGCLMVPVMSLQRLIAKLREGR